MAAAYATFANNGIYREPTTYLRVIDSDDTVLLDNSSYVGEPVLQEDTVFYINTMLENVIKNGTGHDANFSGMTIAGKTGTTTSNNDKWFVGYSPYYTAAVWVGYDQQERIPSGSYLGAQMWKKVMQPLHEGLEDKDFQQPSNLVTQYYCKDSGMLPTEWCTVDARGSRVTSGVFVSGDQPTGYCTVHVPQEICMDSPILDANGEPTGMYHAYNSEYCPEESKNTVAVLDYDRERVTDSVRTNDDAFLLSTLEALPDGGICDVHTAETVQTPETNFDPLDPSTWPTDDPNFNPLDPSTWPNAGTQEPTDPDVTPH